jgi:hypothetical protein
MWKHSPKYLSYANSYFLLINADDERYQSYYILMHMTENGVAGI